MRAGTGRSALRVSLVATVFNEYGSLPAWLEGLGNQSRFPDEFIVVDGGSEDGTLEALRSVRLPFPLEVVECRGSGISAGRNIAISRSTGDIIVVTDAGTQAEPAWLARLIEPFEASPNVDVAAGFFEGAGTSFWARTLAAATLPSVNEINPDTFLASSRSVAVRRSWIDYGLEYPEWLDYCEDVVLDLKLRRAGAKQCFVSDARVRFEPRRGPISFFMQYFRYARGDGKAGLFAHRHAIRYGTYLGAVAVLARRRRSELIAAGLLGLLYIRPGIRRYMQLDRGNRPTTVELIAVPATIGIQRLIGDVAKMLGYPVGLVWRFRKDRDWRFWKSIWSSRLPSGDLPRF